MTGGFIHRRDRTSDVQVTLLGTGSAFPSPERLQSGTLVESGDRRLLVDCGSGVLHRLRQSGVDFREVSTVLLTHHHLDHVADLPSLFKARILSDIASLEVIGPPGTRAICEQLFAIDGLASRGDARIVERSLDDAPFEIAGFDVDAVETTHGKPCFAYRFDDRLVLSGDTAPDEEVFALADGAHTLVHECAYPDGVETDAHTTPAGLLAGVADLAIERIVLTHLFPEAEARQEDIHSTLMEGLTTEVIVGEDGMRLGIPD